MALKCPKSKKNFILFFAVLILIFSLINSSVVLTKENQYQSQKKSLRILFLNLRSGLSPWSLSMLDSCMNELERSTGLKVEIIEENISVLKDSDEKYIDVYASFLSQKYKSSVDFIIIRHFFKGIEKIIESMDCAYVIMPSLDESQLIGKETLPEKLFISSIRFAPSKTASTALGLNPGVEKIIVISGTGKFGTLLTKRAREEMADKFKGVNVEYWLGLPFNEILERLKKLDKDNIILYLTMELDNKGTRYLPRRVAQDISSVSKSPVFGLASSYFTGGIAGGYIDSSTRVGKRAAEMIFKILNKINLDKVVNIEDYGVFQFDWIQLRKWGLCENKLPKNSSIINRPSSFFQRNPIIIWSLFISTILLSLFMVFIIFYINRKRIIQHKLKLSNERYQRLFNYSPIALWEEDFTELIDYIKDLKNRGVKDFREFFKENPLHMEICASKIKVIDINQSAINLHEAEDKYQLLSNIDKTFTRTSFEAFKKELIAIAKGDTFFESEAEVKSLKNNTINILLSIRFYNGKKGGIHGLVAMTDITERKKGENEREKLKDQLMHAGKMASFGRLAGGVAHDYNNALSIITSFTELALEENNLSKEVKKHLNEVLKASKSAAEITGKLLAFARKQSVSPKVYNLNKGIQEMLKMINRLIGEDIVLKWRPGDDLWNILIDPVQVDQILINLCINARDAIFGSGEIIIETQNISLDRSFSKDLDIKHHEFVMLSVTDSGCGMDKKLKGNIFEPFFTTKGDEKGTGLGLATVYGIVKQNNGQVNVHSEPEKGSIFKVYFPREKVFFEQKEIKNRYKEKDRSSGETIVIVEDDFSILKLTEKILKSKGYNVICFASAIKAFKVMEEKSGKIDLLITDVIMPEINGKELHEKLCKIFPDLKVLFMSGYTANVIANHGVLDKGVNFIQKPFSKSDFYQKIKKIISS